MLFYLRLALRRSSLPSSAKGIISKPKKTEVSRSFAPKGAREKSLAAAGIYSRAQFSAMAPKAERYSRGLGLPKKKQLFFRSRILKA